MSLRRARRQDVKHGDPWSQCPVMDDGKVSDTIWPCLRFSYRLSAVSYATDNPHGDGRRRSCAAHNPSDRSWVLGGHLLRGGWDPSLSGWWRCRGSSNSPRLCLNTSSSSLLPPIHVINQSWSPYSCWKHYKNSRSQFSRVFLLWLRDISLICLQCSRWETESADLVPREKLYSRVYLRVTHGLVGCLHQLGVVQMTVFCRLARKKRQRGKRFLTFISYECFWKKNRTGTMASGICQNLLHPAKINNAYGFKRNFEIL